MWVLGRIIPKYINTNNCVYTTKKQVKNVEIHIKSGKI